MDENTWWGRHCLGRTYSSARIGCGPGGGTAARGRQECLPHCFRDSRSHAARQVFCPASTLPTSRLEYGFTFPLPAGLHARPASFLRAVADRFAAAAQLVNVRTGAAANAKSVLSMVGWTFGTGDPCQLRVDGPDERGGAGRALGVRPLTSCPGATSRLPAVAGRHVSARRGRAAPVAAGRGAGPVPARDAGQPRRGHRRGRDRRRADVAARPGDRQGRPGRGARTAGVRRRRPVAVRRNRPTAQAKAATNKQEAEVLAAHAALADDVALAERVDTGDRRRPDRRPGGARRRRPLRRRSCRRRPAPTCASAPPTCRTSPGSCCR